MKPECSYRQSHKPFEDKAKHEKSHRLACKIVEDTKARGVCLEDLVRHSLPRLKIERLERILRLIQNILKSKYESREHFEGLATNDFQVSN
jgi:hypothetical protein